MKAHQKAVIEELRKEGYAIGIFSPEELGNAPARDIEDALVREGNESIEVLQESTTHE